MEIPMSGPDDELEPETDDAELIAYLDGELGPDEARILEARLANDSTARIKAEEYAKTFNLLDYLPKPEPSTDFTNRTLTRIQPALQPGSASSQSFVLTTPSASASAHRGGWGLLAWTLLLLLAGGIGYGGHFLAKPYLGAKPADTFDQADLPLIHELPWLLGVDDIEFLRKLQTGDLFDDEASPMDPKSAVPTDRVSLSEQQKLIELFLSFPSERQQQLRTLHKQLREEPSLRPLLEAYATWLDRLPEGERREVLSAPNGELRWNVIRQMRERHWREALPQNLKALLARAASAEETLRLANELRDREQSRREEWDLAKRQWQPNKADQPKPWPFSDPSLAKQLDGYVKSVLGVDLNVGFERKGERLEFVVPTACRLTREELNELKIKYDLANRDGYWGVYAECLYRMSERHPGLPRPGKGEAIVRANQLPVSYNRHLPKDGMPKKLRFEQMSGKWPEFALAIHDAVKSPKAGESLPPLGPSKPGEFTDEVNSFLNGQLLPALADPKSKRELDALASAEGKWPEYPRLVMDIAKARNMFVPGVSLPGDPDLWTRFYKRSTIKK
jgi:hypothetical protein